MPKLVAIHEAAKELSVSSDTIRRLIRAKRISAVHVGRRVMVPTEAIERLARKGTGSETTYERK